MILLPYNNLGCNPAFHPFSHIALDRMISLPNLPQGYPMYSLFLTAICIFILFKDIKENNKNTLSREFHAGQVTSLLNFYPISYSWGDVPRLQEQRC